MPLKIGSRDCWVAWKSFRIRRNDKMLMEERAEKLKKFRRHASSDYDSFVITDHEPKDKYLSSRISKVHHHNQFITQQVLDIKARFIFAPSNTHNQSKQTPHISPPQQINLHQLLLTPNPQNVFRIHGRFPRRRPKARQPKPQSFIRQRALGRVIEAQLPP